MRRELRCSGTGGVMNWKKHQDGSRWQNPSGLASGIAATFWNLVESCGLD